MEFNGLLPKQQEKADLLIPIIKKHRHAYYCAETRTGKTLTSFECARRLGAETILFVAPPKAQASARTDFGKYCAYWDWDASIAFTTIQSIHKFQKRKFGFIIMDEAHKLGAFSGRPNVWQKAARKTFTHNKDANFLLMSATPNAEGKQHIFRQLWVLPPSTFYGLAFYQFVGKFIDVVVSEVYAKGGQKRQVKDYSNVREDYLEEAIGHLFVYATQEEVGIKTKIEESFLFVEMKDETREKIREVVEEKILRTSAGEMELFNAPAIRSKVHQLGGGAVIHSEDIPILDEAGRIKRDEKTGKPLFRRDSVPVVLDYSIAEEIDETLPEDARIAIFYHYDAERILLEKYFDGLTTQIPELFENGDYPIFLGQSVSASEGVKLASADFLVVYSMGFSAKTYIQTRNRIQALGRTKASKVVYVVSDCGIGGRVLEAVRDKLDYTLDMFKKDAKKASEKQSPPKWD